MQLSVNIPDTVYYDAKQMNDDEASDLIDKIADDIKNNVRKTYLIDEATYLFEPERSIAKLGYIYSVSDNDMTKVVFAGSQSLALEAWGLRAFGGNAEYIKGTFIDYPEWLAYKGISEVSADTYNAYICGTRDFYKDFHSLDEYLKGCIEETIVSNLKTNNIIRNNYCEGLDAEILKTLMYATLISRHNRPPLESFFDREHLFKDIKFSFKEYCKTIGNDTVIERIDRIFNERYNQYHSTDFEILKQGLIFLHNCGLITLTSVSSENKDFEKIIDVYKDLTGRYDEAKIRTKNELFSNVNICVNYPMFYADIVKEILQENMPKELPKELLGSLMECHIRGLLPEKGSYEYHSENEHEVDYVNYIKSIAIEFTVADKRDKDVYLNELPDDFEKILLFDDRKRSSPAGSIRSYIKPKENITIHKNGIERIPYYKFVYDISIGKKLHEQYCLDRSLRETVEKEETKNKNDGTSYVE